MPKDGGRGKPLPYGGIKKAFQVCVGEALGPPAKICTSSVGSAKPGAQMESHQRQFLQTQGPVARREFRPATQILRAGYVLPSLSGNSRNGGPEVSGPMGLGGAKAEP